MVCGGQVRAVEVVVAVVVVVVVEALALLAVPSDLVLMAGLGGHGGGTFSVHSDHVNGNPDRLGFPTVRLSRRSLP